jgi:hypothetical protein
MVHTQRAMAVTKMNTDNCKQTNTAMKYFEASITSALTKKEGKFATL